MKLLKIFFDEGRGGYFPEEKMLGPSFWPSPSLGNCVGFSSALQIVVFQTAVLPS